MKHFRTEMYNKKYGFRVNALLLDLQESDACQRTDIYVVGTLINTKFGSVLILYQHIHLKIQCNYPQQLW